MKRTKRVIIIIASMMVMMSASMTALAVEIDVKYDNPYEFRLSTGSMALTAYSGLVIKDNAQQNGYVKVDQKSNLTEDRRMWFTVFDGNHEQKGTEVAIGSAVERQIPYDLAYAVLNGYLQLRGRMGAKDAYAVGTWKP